VARKYGKSIKPEKPGNIPYCGLFAIKEAKENRNGIKGGKSEFKTKEKFPSHRGSVLHGHLKERGAATGV